MPGIACFAPVASPDARILILGSMPGRKSLEQAQYYAHPANAFWKIMGALYGATPSLPYPARLEKLTSSGIALWDVLSSCERLSSMDAHIRNETANDFTQFFATHPRIGDIYFNGSKAQQCFQKLVLGKQQLPSLSLHRLPSTSPALAGLSFEEKLAAWQCLLA